MAELAARERAAIGGGRVARSVWYRSHMCMHWLCGYVGESNCVFNGRGERSPVARDVGPLSADDLREMATHHRRIDASSHFGNHSTEASALVESIKHAILYSGTNQDRDTRLKQLVDAFGGSAPTPITQETRARDLVVALQEYCAGVNAISTADGSKVAAWHATERKRRDVDDIISDIEWLERPRTPRTAL